MDAEDLNRPRLLITGINGLIGGLLHPALQGEYDVYGFDLDGPFGDRVLKADVSDPAQVEAVFRRFGPLVYVVHLAGDARVDAPWEMTLSANIAGTRNVYATARQAGVRRVVFASTNHVTGVYAAIGDLDFVGAQPEPEKITVHHPIRPDSDYGVSKAFGEALARFYSARWGLESVCLRIGAVTADDAPSPDATTRKMWLSHRDLVQLVRCSLAARVVFGIYFGISDNRGAYHDIENARRELGYHPQDDSAELTRT